MKDQTQETPTANIKLNSSDEMIDIMQTLIISIQDPKCC